MVTHSSTDMAVIAPATTTPKVSKVKRFAQMAGSAVLSVGLVSTFSLPAYAASPNADGTADGAAPAQAQALTTADINSDVAGIEASTADYDEADDLAAEAARLAEEEAEAAEANAEASEPSQPAVDIPSGEGAAGLAAAAQAQLGVSQDCTDAVQNALAAIGLTERRDQGGYDHGVGDFYRYGTVVSSGQYAPGDILIYGGHVAIYIGNGQMIESPQSGDVVKISPVRYNGMTPNVVRLL